MTTLFTNPQGRKIEVDHKGETPREGDTVRAGGTDYKVKGVKFDYDSGTITVTMLKVILNRALR